MKMSLLSAVAVAGLAASAQAAVILPSNKVQVTSDAVFDTSFEPRIDVTTGQLVGVPTGPTLTAYGEVLNLSDAHDSSKLGTITGELTWKFTGEVDVNPADVQQRLGTDGKSVHYSMVTTIKNAELKFYDDEAPDFNVLSMVGQSASHAHLANATNGDLWLHARPQDGDLRGIIEISFFRVSETANFSSFKITQQYINNEVAFDVIGGSILDQGLPVEVIALNAQQLGPYPPGGGTKSFSTELLDNVLVNAPVDELIRANSSAVIQIIPEPASAMLLGLGGLVMLARRRAQMA